MTHPDTPEIPDTTANRLSRFADAYEGKARIRFDLIADHFLLSDVVVVARDLGLADDNDRTWILVSAMGPGTALFAATAEMVRDVAAYCKVDARFEVPDGMLILGFLYGNDVNRYEPVKAMLRSAKNHGHMEITGGLHFGTPVDADTLGRLT